ncbi:MAG: cobalt-precorrin-5B (C(1))-methyltransferase CbiD [Lachnospiraceae bacterium]|jgi:cobalt-precorrin-5B (C1)-methyltransferase
MEHKTGIESYYTMKNNKKLRFGYTTGTCAAAAAKAAVRMLLTKQRVETIPLMTPKGILLDLEILDISCTDEMVSCAVKKDGGDDPDATNGICIYAAVSKTSQPGVTIDGGRGVGRITKKGLEQPVGSAAINRVPRQMITEAVTEICEACDYEGGISVVISIPEGETISTKTFNPRLGIEGGISVLGTSGIVEPMSEAALIQTIRVEMQQRVENGAEYLLVTPGNYGAAYLREHMDIDFEQNMKCSNYVGETIDMAMEMGVKGILFISHVGKFIKVAAGIMNTHSHNADARAEIIASNALRAGAEADTARAILQTNTTDEAIQILKEQGILQETMNEIMERILYYLNFRSYHGMLMGAIIFSNEHGYLGQTDHVEELIEKIEQQKEDKGE